MSLVVVGVDGSDQSRRALAWALPYAAGCGATVQAVMTVNTKDLDDVRLGLARQPGVYYVSLERWDRDARAATLEVLCSVDVRALLAPYIDDLRVGRVQVAGGNQLGDVLKAVPHL